MRIIAQQKAAKKLDASGDDSNPNADVLSNRTLWVADAIKTWMQVFDVLEHEIINCLDDSTEEDDNSYTTKIKDVSYSEMHKIVLQPRIIPYNNMISWALEYVNIQTRSIINH